MEDFFTGVLVSVIIACVVILLLNINIQSEKGNICRAHGYVQSKTFAGTEYCIRVGDEGLIGVPLTTLE